MTTNEYGTVSADALAPSSKKVSSVERLGLRYGLYTALGLAAYFMLMALFGLSQNLWLRMFNFIIMGTGVLLTLRKLYSGAAKPDYYRGLAAGMITAVVGTISFAVFMTIYLSIDTAMMKVIKESIYHARFMNPFIISVGLCIEGILSGYIITFTAMQWYKEGRLKQLKS